MLPRNMYLASYNCGLFIGGLCDIPLQSFLMSAGCLRRKLSAFHSLAAVMGLHL